MKRLILILLFISLCGCVDKGIYTDEEYETLKNLGIEKQAVEECANPETVQKLLKGDFKKENLPTYCKLKLDSTDGVNVMIDKGLTVEEIEEYLSYSYMRLENLDRYIQYESDSIQDKILKVNMDLDLKPYENIKIVDKIVKKNSSEKLSINQYRPIVSCCDIYNSKLYILLSDKIKKLNTNKILVFDVRQNYKPIKIIQLPGERYMSFCINNTTLYAYNTKLGSIEKFKI